MSYKNIMFCLGGVALPSLLMAKSNKPNIVFILCDDMGYGDLGCYGQQYIQTPNIDRLAKEGIRFTQAYSGSPVSAPSRASLMTGQHSGHCAVRGNKEFWKGTVLYGENRDYEVVGQMPYDPEHVILTEILKDNGYTTGVFGKWAGGYEGSVSSPDKRGVDEFYGYICQFQAHLYYPNFLNRYSSSLKDTGVVREILEQNIQFPMYGNDYFKRSQYSADLIHNRAIDWIKRQSKDKPFCGFLTYTLPHAELVQPDDSILQKYKEIFINDKKFSGSEGSRYNAVTHTHAEFAGMITRLDAYVGEILRTLKECGLEENTLVIFTSDNGPHEEGGADPKFFGRDGKLKGLKRQCYEGGIRVPFIAYWPGKIKRGQVCDLQFAFYDIMPTFCDLIGQKNYIKKYKNKRIASDYFDGISIYPTLLGNTKRQKTHPFLYWEFHETNQIGLRMGNWKLFVQKGVPHLYNLKEDVHEDVDLAGKYPEKMEQMIKIVKKQHVENPLFRVTLPK